MTRNGPAKRRPGYAPCLATPPAKASRFSRRLPIRADNFGNEHREQFRETGCPGRLSARPSLYGFFCGKVGKERMHEVADTDGKWYRGNDIWEGGMTKADRLCVKVALLPVLTFVLSLLGFMTLRAVNGASLLPVGSSHRVLIASLLVTFGAIVAANLLRVRLSHQARLLS